MKSATVRISGPAREILRQLSERTGEPMQAILDRALEQFRRRVFLEEANEKYKALRKDKKAWKAELKERREWDAVLGDGD